ncbi:hypothetical protein ACFLQ2_01295 [archaeon]
MPKEPDYAAKGHEAMQHAEEWMQRPVPLVKEVMASSHLSNVIDYCGEALKQDPKDHKSRFNLAKALVYVNRDAEASEHFAELLKEGSYVDQVDEFLLKHPLVPSPK